jgi:hypothetical protein
MSTKYTDRCNSPETAKRWRESGLVRIDSLRAGGMFECIDGYFWTVDGRTKTGTIRAEPWGRDAEPDTFVSSAMVRPVMWAKEGVARDDT